MRPSGKELGRLIEILIYSKSRDSVMNKIVSALEDFTVYWCFKLFIETCVECALGSGKTKATISHFGTPEMLQK